MNHAPPALAATFANLTTALALTTRPSASVLDRVNAGMKARARVVHIVNVRTGARLMIAQPWRLGRLFIDHELKPLDVLLHECRVRLSGELQRGREGHWTFDNNRLIALKQAHLCLRFVRRFGEVA